MDIDPAIPPSGSGCVECLASGGWWLHLRRCAGCGHIGCCDSSPSQHASHHAADTGHPIIQSYEPGEEWFWDYATQQFRSEERRVGGDWSSDVCSSDLNTAERFGVCRMPRERRLVAPLAPMCGLWTHRLL